MVKRELKKIVLINQHTAYLFIDIVNAFCKEYDEVALITGKIATHDIPINNKTQISKLNNHNKGNAFSRILSWLIAFFRILCLIKVKFRKHEILFTTNPPILPFVALFCRNQYSILVYDIFPDGLVADGFVKESSLINKAWVAYNKKIYDKATTVFTLSNGMSEILTKYVNRDKIKIIPVWHSSLFNTTIRKEENLFIKENKLEGKFLVMYSGNLAPGHDIESLVELASVMKNNDQIHFIIAGSGWKYEKIKTMIRKENLTNISLLPLLPVALFKHALCAADIGVVTISKEASQLGVPSKTFNLLAAGKPLLCIADHNSELSSLVNKYNIGVCFESNEISKMHDFILLMFSSKENYNTLSKNAFVCSKSFSSTLASNFVN